MLDSAAFAADLDQLARDMADLHALANHATIAAEQAYFARLEHTISWRLDILAYRLAAGDNLQRPTRKRKEWAAV